MMFIILSYDVNEKRVKKVGKTVKKYLWQIHRSVYNGHLTEKKLKCMKTELKRLIVPSEDSVYIYTTATAELFHIEQIGEIKETDFITL